MKDDEQISTRLKIEAKINFQRKGTETLIFSPEVYLNHPTVIQPGECAKHSLKKIKII